MTPQTPAAVSVNVDVDSRDAAAAGASGLFGRYSYGRYGAREGMWRLLDLFAAEALHATFFFDVGDAERHPHLVEAAAAEGHEVAPQGSVVSGGVTDLAALDDLHARWTALAGAPPSGWRFAGGVVSAEALDRLAELGVVYDSTFEDDDNPYVLALPSGRLAELPVFQFLTDATFYAGRHTPARVAAAWEEEAAALHGAGGYLHLTLHLRGDIGSTRAVRVAVVRDLVRRVKALSGTGFLRCDEIAAALADVPAEVLPDYPGQPPATAAERIPRHLRRTAPAPAAVD